MKSKNRFWVYPLVLIGLVLILTNSCKKEDTEEPTPPPATVTDIDGNVYHTITIGKQAWLVENLKTTKYRNGDIIPNITDTLQWNNLTTGAYCDYNNYPVNSTTYGKLYNWYAAHDSRNIAPEGWHVPTDAEWAVLIDFLGGDALAGGKLKETGTIHWKNSNIGATNESGFTALSGGTRNDFGTYSAIGYYGYWWSSSENYPNSAFFRGLLCDFDDVYRYSTNMTSGFSIRCIRD